MYFLRAKKRGTSELVREGFELGMMLQEAEPTVQKVESQRVPVVRAWWFFGVKQGWKPLVLHFVSLFEKQCDRKPCLLMG